MKSGSSVISLLLLSLIHEAWLVKAGIFLKAKDPYHSRRCLDIPHSTLITSIAPDVRANEFQKAVDPLENVYPASEGGGHYRFLYNRDESCTLNIQQPIPSPFYAATPQQSQVAKIALIKKQGNCTLVNRIMNVQLEGAIGVIVYDSAVKQQQFIRQ